MCDSIKINVTKTLTYDTVVIGGGVAGCAAATAAARHGAKTLLIETAGSLGGIATLGLVTPLDARADTTGKSFGGLIKEITEKTVELSHKYYSDGDNGEHYDVCAPHILKYVLADTVSQAGADIAFHTTILSAEVTDDKITAVYCVTKSGVVRYRALNFIDCSGDAQLVALSGADSVLGSEPGVFAQLSEEGMNKVLFAEEEYNAYEISGLMQPVSAFIVMGNVELAKAGVYNNAPLKFGDLGITKEKFADWKFAGTCGFEITDDRIPMPQGRVLVLPSARKDIAVVNMSRILDIDGSDADSLNRGELLAHKQIIAIVDFLKTFIPGFENSYFMESSCTLGVRESRRAVGKYVLSGKEAINCKKFDYPIARGSYVIDIHDPAGKERSIGGAIKGDSYDIPYGCIVSKNISNLLFAGRCISADHIAHSTTRIQGTCIMTGQAAGTAAALCTKDNIPAAELSQEILHNELLKDGVFLD